MARILGAKLVGEGRPALFVHGFPFHAKQWRATLGVAPQIRARCICPHLSGFGDSPFDGGAAPEVMTMEAYADDLAATLDSLRVGEPVVLVGFSMGGYVALQFFRKHRSRVRALVLCNTRAIADTPEGAAGRLAMAERVLAEGPNALIESMLPKLLSETTLRSRPEVGGEVRTLMECAPREAIAAALRGMACRPDSTALLPQIDVPTLVIVGEHDAISSPAEMRGIAAAIPGASFVQIPGAGHMTTHENPEALAAALRGFVESV